LSEGFKVKHVCSLVFKLYKTKEAL